MAKPNSLHNKVIEIIKSLPKGKVADLGAGDGSLDKHLKDEGFEVVALDADKEHFYYGDEIKFEEGDLNKGLPFEDRSFDYVIMLEVIEHLENPYFVLKEINRILKTGGVLILSTPNILNLKSRLRFLFEGSWEFFREPIIEQVINSKSSTLGIHICPYRFQELEYLLFKNNFEIKGIYTNLSLPTARYLAFFLPLIKLQCLIKRKRSARKGGPNYLRIHKILLSPELLYGQHLIVKAHK